MQRLILLTVLIGLVSGLLVGAYHNIFTVPVIERAIVFEEERAAAELPPGSAEEDEELLVSLGVQRIGMAVGTGIYGMVLGLVFLGAYGLLRRKMPETNPIILAIAAGALGFWAISLLPFLKYPLNPPGVGEGATLVSRQMFQTLFFFLSGAAVVALLIIVNYIRSSTRSLGRRQALLVASAAAYGASVLLIFFLLPANPDPVAVPSDLLFNFRALSIIGQFLLWALIAAGFVYFLRRRQRAAREGA